MKNHTRIKNFQKTKKLITLLKNALATKHPLDTNHLLTELKHLIEHPFEPADVNNEFKSATHHKNGNTALGKPILLAAALGDVQVLQYLLSQGAKLNIEEVGDNPLRVCLLTERPTQEDKIACALELIQRGVDVTEKGEMGRTALFEACWQGLLPVVQMIVSKISPTELNERDVAGWTALDAATAQGQAAVVKYLLEKGALVGQEGDEDTLALILDLGLLRQDRNNVLRMPGTRFSYNLPSSFVSRWDLERTDTEDLQTLQLLLESGQLDASTVYRRSGNGKLEPLDVFYFLASQAERLSSFHNIAYTQFHTLLLEAGAGLNAGKIPDAVKKIFKIPTEALFCLVVHARKDPKQRKVITTLKELQATLNDPNFEFFFPPLLRTCESRQLQHLPFILEIKQLLREHAPEEIKLKVERHVELNKNMLSTHASSQTPLLSKNDLKPLHKTAVHKKVFLDEHDSFMQYLDEYTENATEYDSLLLQADNPLLIQQTLGSLNRQHIIFHQQFRRVAINFFENVPLFTKKHSNHSTFAQMLKKLSIKFFNLQFVFLKNQYDPVFIAHRRDNVVAWLTFLRAMESSQNIGSYEQFLNNLDFEYLCSYLFLSEIALLDNDEELAKYYGQESLILLNNKPASWETNIFAKACPISLCLLGLFTRLCSRFGWHEKVNKWLELSWNHLNTLKLREDNVFIAIVQMFEHYLQQRDLIKAQHYLQRLEFYQSTVMDQYAIERLRLTKLEVQKTIQVCQQKFNSTKEERGKILQPIVVNTLGNLATWDNDAQCLILNSSLKGRIHLPGLQQGERQENQWFIKRSILKDPQKLLSLCQKIASNVTTALAPPSPISLPPLEKLGSILTTEPTSTPHEYDPWLANFKALCMVSDYATKSTGKKLKKKSKPDKEEEEDVEQTSALKKEPSENFIPFDPPEPLPAGYCDPIMIRSPSGGFPDYTHFLIMPTRTEFFPFFKVVEREKNAHGQYVAISIAGKGKNKHGIKFTKKRKDPLTRKTLSSIKIKNSDDERAIGKLCMSYINKQGQLVRLYQVDEITNHKKFKKKA